MAGGEFRSQLTTANGMSSLVTGHGKPVATSNGAGTTVASHVVRSVLIPPLVAPILLTAFQNPNYSIQYGGTAVIGSETVSIVRIANDATNLDSLVTPQTWYFDAETNLPSRIEYRMPDGKRPYRYLNGTLDVSDYRSASGVLYPTEILRSREGSPYEKITVESLTLNTAVPSTEFDSSIGGVQ
jgi:hypothetical protein